MDDCELVQIQMIQQATQYNASGRFATLNAMVPGCGNLLHHAVEMYLRGSLARHSDLHELKNLGHDLKKIWCRTKSAYLNVDTKSFDVTIEKLDRFERIRYPDELIKEGAIVQIDIHRNEWLPSREKETRREPMYNFVLEDIDELVKVDFEFASLNPLFFSGGVKKSAIAMLNDNNLHPIFSS